MISQRAVDAIESSDTDELLRVVDGYCSAKEWDNLVQLRHRCQEALTRGKQLWGVDEHVRYRLALEAPPAHAGPVLTEGAARFALGPLAEVAASTKTWADMSPHLAVGPERTTFAAERVVRGDTVDEEIADLPNFITNWEPSYRTATYKSDKVEALSPMEPSAEPSALDDDPEVIGDAESETALADLVQAWTTESNGRCSTATVQGRADAAVRALGISRAGLVPVDTATGLEWMAWAAASGGAHGRRRGAAAGRYGAWWAIAEICELDWPPDPEEAGDAVAGLSLNWFDDGSPSTGWQLRLAIEDRENGLSWAVAAADSAD